jgi:hypothetical protein
VEARSEPLEVGHVVKFDDQQDELAGYLLDAGQDDGAAVLIATAAHRRPFGTEGLHRSVIGGWPPAAGATRIFALSADAPAAARHFAVDAVRRLAAADLADDAALVVTELAANAVVHARSGFTVDLAAGPDTLRIAVRDASPLPPGAGLPAGPLHGLGAVDTLASRWGVEPLGPSGKSVWVELSR